MAMFSRSNSLKQWITEADWWVVKGTTGSGKTFFVEQIKLRIAANHWPVVYVPQFPIFKPQLNVKRFINLLPLSKEGRASLFSDLDALGVPMTGLIGGKFLGMLDLPGLSGGQRKKMLVAISVAMAKEFQCPFMVLDEPFAGVDEGSMPRLLEMMTAASKAVPGLKYIIVTHDHFELLPTSAQILEVADRKVTGKNGHYEQNNFDAANDFAEEMLLTATASPKPRPFFDSYIVKRHFVEQEFVQPLLAIALFACLLGTVVVNYEGSLPGLYNKDALYVFMTGFMLDYPNFGSLMNYCFKRAQHLEDFYLNVTASEYAVLETFVIVLIQCTMILGVGEAIMCGISSFWFISWEALLLNWFFYVMDTFAFLLAAVVFPNPMVANIALLPYAVFLIIFNGTMLPQDYFWPAIKWTPMFSPNYHFGCAYTAITDKIELANTDCDLPFAVNVVFCHPFWWILLVLVAIKVITEKRRRAPLKIDLSRRQIGASSTTNPVETATVASPKESLEMKENVRRSMPDDTLPKLLTDRSVPATKKCAEGSQERKMIDEVSIAPTHKLSNAELDQWVADTAWWVVKGATGSGKTYFVETLMSSLRVSGREVVYVPQYPMFKPQLTVKMYLSMLPLSKETSAELSKSLEAMSVPTSGLVGGALYGMLNLPGLSGGQRKKLMVAVSVAIASQYKCPFVILDEPFAGIDARSMESVVGVLKKAECAVPGLKFIIVTHDHFDLFAASSSVLRAVDRRIVADIGFDQANHAAAHVFTQAMMLCPSNASSRRPWVDWYVVKRYFIEQEFMLPLLSYIIFGVLMALTMTEYEGELPGLGLDVIFVFMKMFALEFPHFASIINYCFKRGQHMEDFFLNVTTKKYCLVESVIIAVVQAVVTVCLFNAILGGICNFWWINIDVALIDLFYVSINTVGYFLLPLLCPNPIVAMVSILPNICVWGFTNGIIFPKSDMWVGIEWTTTFSAVYNIGCAYQSVADGKIALQGVDCIGSLGTHLLLAHTFSCIVFIGCIVKMLITMHYDRKKGALLAEQVKDRIAGTEAP